MKKFYFKKKINKNKKNRYLFDYYINKSKNLNFRSRSWFKIDEIQNKYNIFKKNISIIDLGSSPGGWSKYSSQYIGDTGHVFSCDVLNMKKILGVNFFQGNLKENKTYNNFIKFINCNKINVIISDMLSNTSGHHLIDNSENFILIKIALNLCFDKLIKGGSLVLKLLENYENNNFIKNINSFFKEVYLFKPNSSRKFSREFYLIAKYFI